ncbi:Protoporphyrinogen oxidase [Halanaeroarchaeum sp. HSR-CO]|uniref:protoporphyrinogen oxidase n=1 Tax=Halanaeroarchaeum sp. HSR-CO TaxID=2866382 RepID=UPI00217E9829|nr:protoporphyrinogen oxidase [Halanaeroarchaeum sp. HSR-CO]UWG49077.1 Protoporphyrinogen oxidase [Halanaeroarchaeum sp. HSR-CO]
MSGSREEHRIAVIGAGMSGLATVHYLPDEFDVVVYEADDEVGGVVSSLHRDGHVLETGPQRLRSTGPVEAFIDAYDLHDEVVVGDDDQPLFAYFDGALRPMPLSVRRAITTDLLSWRGKARVLLEPLTGPPQDDETVAEYLARAFGREAATRFMGPLYSGLYGSDPDEMYVRYSLGKALEHAGIEGSVLRSVLGKLREGVDIPEIITFTDGLQTLPAAIYDRHAESIHLGTAVTDLETAGEGYRLYTEDGTDPVDTVVLATPAPTAGSLLQSVAPAAGDAIAGLTYNALGVVHLHSAYDGHGHGFHVVDDGYITGGSTWNHSMLGREGIYTSYVASGDPSTLSTEPSVLGRRAATEFEEITGAPATPIEVTVLRPGMPAYDRSWTNLDALELPEDIHLCTAFTERAGIVGRLVDGKRTATAIAEQ